MLYSHIFSQLRFIAIFRIKVKGLIVINSNEWPILCTLLTIRRKLCEFFVNNCKGKKKDNLPSERNYVYNRLITINRNLFYINFRIPLKWAPNSYTSSCLHFQEKIVSFVVFSVKFPRHLKPNNITETLNFILYTYYSSFYPIFS